MRGNKYPLRLLQAPSERDPSIYPRWRVWRFARLVQPRVCQNQNIGNHLKCRSKAWELVHRVSRIIPPGITQVFRVMPLIQPQDEWQVFGYPKPQLRFGCKQLLAMVIKKASQQVGRFDNRWSFQRDAFRG